MLIRRAGIVADGYWRARSAAKSQIRVELAAEYAVRLEDATFWQRLRLKREMNRKVVRRLRTQAPRTALY